MTHFEQARYQAFPIFIRRINTAKNHSIRSEFIAESLELITHIFDPFYMKMIWERIVQYYFNPNGSRITSDDTPPTEPEYQTEYGKETWNVLSRLKKATVNAENYAGLKRILMAKAWDLYTQANAESNFENDSKRLNQFFEDTFKRTDVLLNKPGELKNIKTSCKNAHYLAKNISWGFLLFIPTIRGKFRESSYLLYICISYSLGSFNGAQRLN